MPSFRQPMEGRGGTKGNADPQRTVRTQSRRAVSQAQARIREAVNRNRKEKLTALLHHVAVDCLRAAFFALKKRAAAGIDQVTWDQYAENLEENLRGLHRRVQTGAYRALPSRRTYIPKADGKQRPLGIAAIEDKIVQAAVVMILTPIYEAEFLGFSYGFRPGRSQHNALDALAYGIKGRNVRWILDADIRSFFDTISHVWLVRFIEHRIGDKRIVRLIRKWLKALHYVYDLWVHTWRKRHATGDMVVVRYADDTIVGFQHRADAERFLHDLTERLAKFALDLHPEKTRLIEFGRYAAGDRVRRGEGKPETFDFLGFTHICGTMRDGRRFQLKRKTKRKRKRATLQRIVDELRRIRHSPIDGQGRWLATVLRGHYAYFAVPTNLPAVRALRNHVKMHWFLSLRRRSQRSRLTWSRMNVIAAKHLPLPRVLHPWPEQRFLVSHPR
ncbi:MAG TPA: reverse transcriptase domain-containing protein [Steroidobacteraceae bacterium]|nr:reverse transcriptase domain-containing protein [Steroidobacteraceae bacterium]